MKRHPSSLYEACYISSNFNAALEMMAVTELPVNFTNFWLPVIYYVCVLSWNKYAEKQKSSVECNFFCSEDETIEIKLTFSCRLNHRSEWQSNMAYDAYILLLFFTVISRLIRF